MYKLDEQTHKQLVGALKLVSQARQNILSANELSHLLFKLSSLQMIIEDKKEQEIKENKPKVEKQEKKQSQ